MLLGIIELCKATGSYDLEEIVNKYKMDTGNWLMLVDEVIGDDALDQHLEGELFEALMKLRMWYKEYKINRDKEIYSLRHLYGSE